MQAEELKQGEPLINIQKKSYDFYVDDIVITAQILLTCIKIIVVANDDTDTAVYNTQNYDTNYLRVAFIEDDCA